MGKRGRPKGTKNNGYEFDYAYIAQLSQRFARVGQIAKKLRMTPQLFDYYYNKDEKLRAAMEGRIDTELSLQEAQIHKARGSFMTICKDCGKIKVGVFAPSCPYCDDLEEDPGLRGSKGAHTNVKHKYNEPDTEMLKWLGRVELGQKEVVVHEGSGENPIIFTTLAEFVLNADKKRKAAESKAKANAKRKGQDQD
jgi:hypothetical protein